MSTATKKKPATRKPTAKAPKKAAASWVGSGKGKATVKAGVDLTAPTLPPGKYL